MCNGRARQKTDKSIRQACTGENRGLGREEFLRETSVNA